MQVLESWAGSGSKATECAFSFNFILCRGLVKALDKERNATCRIIADMGVEMLLPLKSSYIHVHIDSPCYSWLISSHYIQRLLGHPGLGGILLGVKPPGIGPAQVTSCKDRVTLI